MEIPDIIKKIISDNDIAALLPLFNVLRENSFDIKKTLSGIKPETLLKLSEKLLKKGAENSPFKKDSGVSPIANVADKDIVFVLNRYINAEK